MGIDLSELHCPEHLRKNVYTRIGADANVRTKCGMGHTNQLVLLCNGLRSTLAKASRMV